MTTRQHLYLNALLQNKTSSQATRAAGFPKDVATQNADALLSSAAFNQLHAKALTHADERRTQLTACLTSARWLSEDESTTPKQRLQANSQALRFERSLSKLPTPYPSQPTFTNPSDDLPDEIAAIESLQNLNEAGTPSPQEFSSKESPLSPQEEKGRGIGVDRCQNNATIQQTKIDLTKDTKTDTPSPQEFSSMESPLSPQGERGQGIGVDRCQDEGSISEPKPTTPLFNPATYIFPPNQEGVYYKDEQGVTRLLSNPKPKPQFPHVKPYVSPYR